MSRALAVYVALTALTLGVFALWPNLDLTVAHYFYDGGGFAGRDSLDRFGRDFFRVTPFVVLAAFAALWLAKRRGAALALGAERPGGDLSHCHDGDRARTHRQSRPQGPLAPTAAVPDPGLQRPEPVQALVRHRRRLPEELLVRLRRGGDRLLDGRAGERSAAALARSRDRRRLRVRNRREPAAGWPSAAIISPTCCSAGSSRWLSSRSSGGSSGRAASPDALAPRPARGL